MERLRATRAGDLPRALVIFGISLAIVVTGWCMGCRTPDDIVAPEVTLRQLLVRQYSGGQARIDLELELDNRNDFDVSLVGIDLELTIDATSLGRVVWKGEQRVRQTTTTRVIIPTELPVGDNDEIFTGLIDRDQFGYDLAGELTAARGVLTLALPVACSGRLNAE